MTQAETLMQKPTPALLDLCAGLQHTSAASKSEARTDLEQDDGSTLVVTSRQGEECEMAVVTPAATE